VSENCERPLPDKESLKALDKNELIKLIEDLDAKYRKSVEEFEHLKAQLEINELVLDTQKKMVEDALSEIHELSITDHLTKLYNRRYFNDVFNKELRRSTREQTYITLAIFDVDNFKSYNDNYGHQKGDEVLMALGKLMHSCLKRSSDYAFRLGGEEFGVLLCGLNSKESFEFCEYLRAQIEELKIIHEYNDASKYVSVSFGVASMIPSTDTTLAFLYNQADKALYEAKARGKNCSVLKEIQGE
jgi:diguanylate cyclase (GGDEF)-like protein